MLILYLFFQMVFNTIIYTVSAWRGSEWELRREGDTITTENVCIWYANLGALSC